MIKNKEHTLSPEFLKNTIYHADVNDVFKHVPDESIHLTFTSPPYYNAKDYSSFPTYDHYLDFLIKIFHETHRITKEGRFFVLNTSPVITPRISRSHKSQRHAIPFDIHPFLETMGWEFIDDIIWRKPEASVKNRNGNFYQNRKPLAYKPNAVSEYIMVYRKATDKLIDWNIRQYDAETIRESKVEGEYESTNVWNISPTNSKIHPAIFPKKLAENIVKLYSFKGDLVFDPFAGIGTLGVVASSMDRYFLMAEKHKEYIDGATKNLEKLSVPYNLISFI